jgi:glutamate--cysteine ligase
MYKKSAQRLSIINSGNKDLFDESLLGLEKECLRVSEDGKIAQTPHPIAFGSALTNPYITTDFSEALLELITPPLTAFSEVMKFLQHTHQFVYSKLQNEILWASSMPCILTGEDSIPIAYYGDSNPGIMKAVYRRGLGYRYGKMMQAIAGIHYNYSLSETFWRAYQAVEEDNRPLQDFITDSYFAAMRNLQRYGWMIPYLFGASPAVCKSFLAGIPSELEPFDEFTYFQPYATSLRVGDIGYQNYKEGKTGIKADYDNLHAYVKSITNAIETPFPDYEKIGVKVNGEYRQLNANILQIENEYYSSIRPKQIGERDEKPSLALTRRGVRYLELRSLDVNVYHPLGIQEQQLYFIEAFIIFCLFQDSPPISPVERKTIDDNIKNTAHRGREPGLELGRDSKPVTLKNWGLEICQAMGDICRTLDEMKNVSLYSEALKAQITLLHDANETPSAKILEEMRRQNEPFFRFNMRYSQNHCRHFQSLELPQDINRFFEDQARQSLQEQMELENQHSISFDDYLANYFSQH